MLKTGGFCVNSPSITTAEGMARLDEKVAALGAEPHECLVAVEKSHGLLVGYLLQTGYVVHAIAPKVVDRSPALRAAQGGARDRDRHRQSDAKTDQFDARVLSDILCVDRDYHEPIPSDSPLAREIQATSRQRQKLVTERTRIKNQLTACLKEYYPAALDLFSGLGVKSRTIQRWVKKGYFPGAYKVGLATSSPYRIPRSDVDAFIEQRERQAKAATSNK